jgi:hypothetical protein
MIKNVTTPMISLDRHLLAAIAERRSVSRFLLANLTISPIPEGGRA